MTNDRYIRWECPDCGEPTLTYIICTNPRTGSWLLSDGLAGTSVAGNPREWFNALEEKEQRARWREAHGGSQLGYPAYLRLACSLSHTGNGISGIKLHHYDFTRLARKQLGMNTGEMMRRLFPRVRYIFLTRRDKVRQAISYRLAVATNVWHVTAGAPRENHREPQFSAHAITRAVESLTRRDAAWEAFFAENGITPLALCYEDDLFTAEDYQRTVARVLGWIGIPGAVPVPPVRLERQSGELTEEWLRRYGTASALPAGHGVCILTKR